MKTNIQVRIDYIEKSINSDNYLCHLAETISTVHGNIDIIHIPTNIAYLFIDTACPEINVPGLNIYANIDVNINNNHLIDAIYDVTGFTSVVAAV